MDVQQVWDLLNGQQAGVPQSLVATFQTVFPPDLLYDETVECLARTRDMATVIENRGDLAVGVTVKQAVDLDHDLSRGLSHLPGRWRQGQRKRLSCAALETDMRCDLVALDKYNVLDEQTNHKFAFAMRRLRVPPACWKVRGDSGDLCELILAELHTSPYGPNSKPKPKS
jgi:hypothetical protein